MEFLFTREQEELRKEVHDVLEKHLKLGHFKVRTDSWGGERHSEGVKVLSDEMVERGWCGMTWPKEYGGQEKTYQDRGLPMRTRGTDFHDILNSPAGRGAMTYTLEPFAKCCCSLPATSNML